MRSDQSSASMTPERRWWKHIDCATAPTPGPFGRPPRVCIGCGRGDGEWQLADAAPPPIPGEAIEAARAVIRERWPVQIAPNTAAALARHAVTAAAPILLAEGRKQAAETERRKRERLIELAGQMERRADEGDAPADCRAMDDFAGELRRIAEGR